MMVVFYCYIVIACSTIEVAVGPVVLLEFKLLATGSKNVGLPSSAIASWQNIWNLILLFQIANNKKNMKKV